MKQINTLFIAIMVAIMVVGTISISAISNTELSPAGKIIGGIINPPVILAYPNHNAVSIHSNAGFNATNGFSSGNGTILNPWVMTNYNIQNETTEFCNVWIQNTTDYFIITECEFISASTAAIYLRNVTNGAVTYSNISETIYGIYMDYETSNITLTGNIIGSTTCGIGMGGVSHVYISTNVISDSSGGTDRGIYVSGSPAYETSNISIGNNDISDYHNGVYIDSAHYTHDGNFTIFSNKFDNCSEGVNLEGSTDIYLDANWYNNSEDGLVISNSDNITTYYSYMYNISYDSIWMELSDYITLQNTFINDTGVGIYAYSVGTLYISNFEILNGVEGTILEYCNGTTIFNGTYSNLTVGALIVGCDWTDFEDVTISDCNNGIQVNETNANLTIYTCTFDSIDLSGIEIEDSTEFSIDWCTFDSMFYGIDIVNSTAGMIYWNTFNNGLSGVYISDSSDLTVAYNNVTNIALGLMVENCTDIHAFINFIDGGFYGVIFSSVTNSYFTMNNITNTNNGTMITDCDNIIISYNSFSNSNNTHLYLRNTTGSLIYYNIFYTADNGDAHDDGTNEWDNGSAGNYWCSYTGIDTDGDGYGNTPYNIEGGTMYDNYPWADVNTSVGVTMYDILIAIMPLVLIIMIFGLLMKNVKKIFVMK
jgi:nitrous oxidase accessory protein NosD